jgi:hypothetical protein
MRAPLQDGLGARAPLFAYDDADRTGPDRRSFLNTSMHRAVRSGRHPGDPRPLAARCTPEGLLVKPQGASARHSPHTLVPREDHHYCLGSNPHFNSAGLHGMGHWYCQS